ncbi:histidine kinase dimerization/phosphoacceptor domain -containing protein [Larkinella humicola]|uniref:histidine kinase n=1 Tax=Larkinella humicola TaxID=2607654 RepID=A0A5N1JSV7_9BACT|nr:histidine kinase dimerization/phosphoacceptor domain -containing protein [Larkinella humicola]KAA9357402.1 hypothetical protein F0P93_06615 [Larkinella humicola]
MFRFTSCFLLLVGWLCIVSESQAQEHPGLRVNPARIQHVRQLEAKALREKDSLLLAESWYLFGEQYQEVGNYQSAHPYFLKALKILEPRGDSYELVKLYVRLSETEQRQSHFQESLHYALTARQVAQRIGSIKGLAIAYRMLGHIRQFIWNGQGTKAEYDSIFFCYKESERLSTLIQDTLKIAEANAFIGALLLRDKAKQSIPYLTKALNLFTLKNDIEWQVRILIHLSTVYQRLGNLRLAWEYISEADHLYASRRLNEHGIRAMIAGCFLTYYEQTHQWEKALDQHRKLTDLEGKRLWADREGALSRLSIEYETAKKEALLKAQKQEIDLRNKALENQQRFIVATTLFSILAVIASIFFYKLYRKNQRINYRNEELLKEQNHRVKNNLQVISSLLNLQSKRLSDKNAKKAVEESRLRIESMALLHRKLYDGDKLAQVDLDEFVRELVQGVLRSYGYDQILPEFEIDAGYLTADKAVPLGLVINELTTNACKYAFPYTVLPRFTIRCHRHKNKIELTVEDNGPGIENAEVSRLVLVQDDRLPNTRKASFGMSLIQSQVVQLNGTSRFVSGSENQSSGTVFTMMFTVS